MNNIPTGCILGGSLSYGRFYNVSGDRKGSSSDTDILLIIPRYELLVQIAQAITELPGLAKGSIESLRQRIDIFHRIAPAHPHCIFSHKLQIWTDQEDPILKRFEIQGKYEISLHIFSVQELEYVTLADVPVIEDGAPRNHFDYRDKELKTGYSQRAFSGIQLGESDTPCEKVTKGVIADLPVYIVQEDRFCPGLYQNVILPQFEIRWESHSTRLYLKLLSMKWKILERLRTERTNRRFEMQHLSLSHVRVSIFAPHVIKRANRDSI